jgi:hypothetical protein
MNELSRIKEVELTNTAVPHFGMVWIAVVFCYSGTVYATDIGFGVWRKIVQNCFFIYTCTQNFLKHFVFLWFDRWRLQSEAGGCDTSGKSEKHLSHLMLLNIPLS